MSLRLGEVALLVDDYDEAITYFTKLLGFDLLEDEDRGAGKRWVRVAPGRGGAALLLARAVTPEQRAQVGHQFGGRVGLFLHSDDFASDHARLLRAGVTFVEAPRHEPYGTVAVFTDAWGNRWDLLQLKAP